MSGALESDRDTYNKSHETNRGIARLRSYPCMYACFFALCNDVCTTLLHNHKDIWTPHSLSNYESPSRSTQDLLPFLHSIKLQKHPFLPYTYSNSTSHSERPILTPQHRELRPLISACTHFHISPKSLHAHQHHTLNWRNRRPS